MFELDPEARTFGVTAVENRFLTDYLAAAKGDYVKVYLWGLYACGQKGPDYTLAEMADDIEMDVPEIEAALRYWERRSLVSHLSDNPPQYRFFSPSQRQQTPVRDLEVDVEYVSFAESVYAAFGDRRKLKNSEILLAWEWVKDYSLPPEAVLMLLHHCIAVERINFSFRKKAEPLAIRMHEAGVQSVDDAEGFLQHNMAVHDGTQRVLSRMGKRRHPATMNRPCTKNGWISGSSPPRTFWTPAPKPRGAILLSSIWTASWPGCAGKRRTTAPRSGSA